jgi:putative tricarboxylic transport membrane protein
MLLILNLPLIGLWVKILKVPYKVLFPFLLLFCIIGSYSINNSEFDVFIMLIFGIIGYLFKKLEYELVPLVMAFVLGPILETSLRQSLLISGGSISIFFKKPISMSCLIIALLVLISPIILKKSRKMRAKVA